MFQMISMKQLEIELTRGTTMTLLDVRTSEEYRAGALQGAVNIPLEDLENRIRDVDKGRPVYVYCGHGNKSLQAARFLDQMGYQVISCAGGLSAYRGRFYEHM